MKALNECVRGDGQPDRQPSPYDDAGFDYLDFWASRRYEHRAEVMALRRLLRGRRFGHAVDIGGGYGRLSLVLRDFADQVTLVDPSIHQLQKAERYLSGCTGVERRLMDAARMDFPDASADLAVLVRVLHHVPDPARELAEVARILKPGAWAVVELANLRHAINRIRYRLRGQKIPGQPVDLRSAAARYPGGIPFVNHHPETLLRQLAACGLNAERVLSVSNLRHPLPKRVLPESLLLAAEYTLQVPLARWYFGPSLFILARKQERRARVARAAAAPGSVSRQGHPTRHMPAAPA